MGVIKGTALVGLGVVAGVALRNYLDQAEEDRANRAEVTSMPEAHIPSTEPTPQPLRPGPQD